MSQKEMRTLDAIDSQGNGLRIEFRRVGARWAHRVVAIHGPAEQAVLESVEGDDTEAFPPSPALQQLSIDRPNDAVAIALLIGMAGKNHWSVGVEAFPQARRIRFDVACKNQPCSVGQLGSAYKMLVPWQSMGSEGMQCTLDRCQYVWSLENSDSTAEVQTIGPPADPIVLQVQVDRSASTQRWCYEFRQVES